jgi:hypothetical protein
VSSSNGTCRARVCIGMALVAVLLSGCSTSRLSQQPLNNQEVLRTLLISGGDPARCRPMSAAESYAVEGQRYTNLLGSRAMPTQCSHPPFVGR